MAQSSDEIVMTADATSVIAAYQKINEAIQKQQQKLKESADAQRQQAREERERMRERAREEKQTESEIAAAKKVNDEANSRALKKLEDEEKKAIQRKKELEAAGKSVWEATRTPLERYNGEVARLSGLLKKGAIDQNTFNRAVDKQNRLLRDSQNAAGGAGAAIAGIGKEALIAFTGIGSAIAGIMTVANAIKGEYEDMKRRAKESATSQLSFGEQMRELASNFTGDDTMDVAGLEPAVKRLMSRTGAKDTVAAGALSAALSGRGNLSNQAAVDIAEQSLRILPGNAEASNQMAMRVGQLMNSAGLTDPRQALGIISQVKNVATVDKLRDVGQSAVPSIMSGIRYGDSAEVSAEMYTAINNLMGDTEGARSATAFVALAEQLRAFSPSAKDLGKAGVDRGLMGQYGKLSSTSQRLAFMQQNPALATAFMDSSSFEKQAITGVRALLSNSPEAQTAMAVAQQGITAPSAAAFEKYVGGINALPSQALVASAQRSANLLAQSKLSDTAGGAAGQAYELFDQSLSAVDLPGIDSWTRRGMNANAAIYQASGMNAPAAMARSIEDVTTRGAGSLTMSTEHLALLQQAVTELRNLSSLTAGAQSPPEAALGRKP